MQRTPATLLRDAIDNATATFRNLEALTPAIEKASTLIVACLLQGRKLLVCGNGGSAADAADFSAEFACRFDKDRRPYPALNLSQGGSLLTATANDYGFDEVFARQIGAFSVKGDVVVVITTSGKSKNIQRALAEAQERELKSIALLGRDGGTCAGVADVEMIVSGNSTARIQEAHKFLLHILCEICEPQLSAR